MKAGELFVQLGVQADIATLKDFAGVIENMSLDAVGLVAEIGGISFALADIAKQAVNASVGFDLFQARTGQSWKELQQWQIVGEQVNVTAQDVESSVESLTRQMADIRLGKGNIFPWQALGIDPRNKDAFKVLDELRSRIKGLDRPLAQNLLGQLGISPNMIKVLELSNEQFEKLAKTTHGMTGAQQEMFLQAKQSIVQFGLVLKQDGIDLIENLVNGFKGLWALGPSVHAIFYEMAAGAAVLAVSLAPLTAGFAALFLILEDFAVYKKGGKSVIGDIMNAFKDTGNNPNHNPFSVANGNLSKSINNALPFVATGIPGVNAASVVNTFNISVHAAEKGLAIATADAVKNALKQTLRHTSSQQGNAGKS